MPPRVFGKTVIERQRRHIETEIGGALHIGVTTKYIGAAPGISDIAGGEQQDAARTDIRRAGRELGLSHGPDQRRGLFLGEDFGDMLDLRFRQTRDPFHLVGRPLRHLFADFVDAVDALAQEFLVLPAVFENVPKHPVDRGDMRARTHANILGGVRCGPRHPGIDNDHVGAVEFLAFKNMLKRNRMRLRGIATHLQNGLGIANIVVTVGHRAIAPGIGDPGDRGGMADTRLMVRVIGSPEGGELPVEVGSFVGELG